MEQLLGVGQEARRGEAAAASHGLSYERLFRLRRRDGPVRTARQSKRSGSASGRTSVTFHTPNPAPGRGADEPLVPARDAPVPLRDAAHGARPQLHDGRRPHALPPPQRAGRCCARWAGTPSACRRRTRRSGRAGTRARSSSATSSRSATQMKRIGWAIDWDREVGAHEPRVLPLDAVAVPPLLRARASPTGRRRRSTGARTTRPWSRTSTSSTAAASAAARRSRRATSSSGSSRSPPTPTSCSSSTCRPAAVARADDGDPAQLDRA